MRATAPLQRPRIIRKRSEHGVKVGNHALRFRQSLGALGEVGQRLAMSPEPDQAVGTPDQAVGLAGRLR